MYTIMTGPTRWRTCLALALPIYLLAACAEDGRIAAPSVRQLTPASDGPAANVSAEASLKGSVSILLEGPYGVSSMVEANPIAQAIHADVTANIRTLHNWHGTISSIEIINACNWLNATACSTWDDIPNYCSVHPDEPEEGAPGADGQASGFMAAKWADKGMSTAVSASRSCPSVVGKSAGGGGGGSGPGSGGVMCYEAWYVWADGSHADQYIGIVCFGGGTNAS